VHTVKDLIVAVYSLDDVVWNTLSDE